MFTKRANVSTPTGWQPEPDFRGTTDIVTSCLGTLIFCVWSAVHLDVPNGQKHGNFLVRIFTNHPLQSGVFCIFIGLLAPEALCLLAFLEWLRAVRILKAANSSFTYQKRRCPWYRRLGDVILWPFNAITRGKIDLDSHQSKLERGRRHIPLKRRHRWNLVHAYYVSMGGFGYCDETTHDEQGHYHHHDMSRIIRLDPDTFHWILAHDPDLLPDISAHSILDKSKADWLAKSVLLIQAIWFCANALARLLQGLSLSLLEVTTFAHAFCTLITYTLWWRKPLNVREPTILHLRPPADLPMVSGDSRIATACALSTFGAIYGLPHVFALNSTFPSTIERDVWRVAALFVCTSPAISLVLVLGMMLLEVPDRFPQLPVIHPIFTQLIACLEIVVYAGSSLFLIVESFRQLWFLPPDAYQLASWSNNIPHFS